MWMFFDAHFSTHLSLFKLYPPPACLTGGAARTIRRLIGGAIREWRSTDPVREIMLGSLILEVLATAYRITAVGGAELGVLAVLLQRASVALA